MTTNALSLSDTLGTGISAFPLGIGFPDAAGDTLPRLIQAGMGVRISSARLANVTSRLGALGVVSSVGLRHIVIEEIRSGDRNLIEIAKTFPVQRYVEELLAYAPGGEKHRGPIPMDLPGPKGELPKRLSAICTYVEVKRAKQGHNGKVGVNVMWKCSLTVLPAIYGAMLAGADALLCGAGVPMELPDIVRRMREGVDLEYLPLNGTSTHVRLAISEDGTADFLSRVKVPKLIPILSNFAFPKRMVDIWQREYGGMRPDAFVLENHEAGGHNAPPRNKVSFGEQDDLETYFEKVRDLGVPVYVAGDGCTREQFVNWVDRGAYGIQVGSRFALCRESGMRDDLRETVIARNAAKKTEVATSNRLSPTGYPFKHAHVPGTLSDQDVYESRKRICNKGYLLQSHFTPQEDGTQKETYICPAMPEKQFAKLGGSACDLKDRVCLCNALFATAGFGDPAEAALITLGRVGATVTQLYSAREILEDLLTPEYVECMERKLAHGAAFARVAPSVSLPMLVAA